MSLNLFTRSSELAMSAAATNPTLDLDAGFGAAMSAAYDARRRFKSSDSEEANRYDFVQGVIDRLNTATGEQYLNPEGLPLTAGRGGTNRVRAWEYAKVRNRLEQLAKDRPDLGLGLLSDGEIRAGTDEIGRRAVAAEQRAVGQQVSGSSSIGAFLGEAGATMRDPVNAAANLLTAPFTAGRTILGAAAQEGGIGGASEFLVQAENYEYRRRVDPQYALADAMGEVGMAAGISALFGGSLRAIAKGWEARPRNVTQQLRDKANVVMRAAAAAKSPFRVKSVAADAAHNQAITKASEDLMLGRPVELPPEAFLAGQARPGRVYDADGRSVGVNYEVVEARDLVTSHDDEFLPDPRFPQELQPRARERPITREQVNAMAAGLQPERLGPSPQADSGSPIVGPDGLVESGNGRVLAIRKAYRDAGASASSYRNFLKSQGYDVDGMAEPVLVARRVTDLPGDERLGFVTAANRSTAMRLSATEQALSDARQIDQPMLEGLEAGDITSAGNRQFVRSFLSKLPRAEQGSMVDAQGNLSIEGARRVSAALLGRAYGDPVLLARALEDADSNIKGLAGALGDAAGAWSRMRDAVARGAIPQGMDITDDVIEALRLAMKARDEKVGFGDLLRQAEMFDGPSDIAKAIGRFFFRDGDLAKPASRAAVADMLQTYAREAEKNIAGDRLFGEALGDIDVLRNALERSGRPDLAYPFGPVIRPDDYGGDWSKLVARMKADRSGDAVGALSHPDIGPIDVIWGRDGNNGFGLAHIIEKHPEVVDDLPNILAGMTVWRRSPNRIRLADPSHDAAVRLDYDGTAKTWLITAFERGAERRRAGDSTVRSRGLQADTSSTSPAGEDIASNDLFSKVTPEQAALAEGRIDPEAMAKLAEDPVLDDGVIREAERMMAEELMGNPSVPKVHPVVERWRADTREALPSALSLLRRGNVTLSEAIDYRDQARTLENTLIDEVLGDQADKFRRAARFNGQLAEDMAEEASKKFPGFYNAYFGVGGRTEDISEFWADLVNAVDFEDTPVESLGRYLRTGMDKLPSDGRVTDLTHSELLGIAQVAAVMTEAGKRGVSEKELFKMAFDRAVELEGRDAPELMAARLQRFKDVAEASAASPRAAAPQSAKPQQILVPMRVTDAAGNETEQMRPLIEVMDELDEEIAAAERIEACASGGETAKPAGGGSAAPGGGDLGALMDVLRSPRRFDFDEAGNITGMQGIDRGQPNEALGELLDALRAPKTFKLDGDGNVTSVEIKK